jgi:type II secretory pathway pseudopilin PulG
MVELLIVIAIIGVLAAVVIPSILGMSGRGGSQTWRLDRNTIYSGAASYLNNVHHQGGIDAKSEGHYWPTYSGMKNDQVAPGWRLYFKSDETVGNRYAYTTSACDTRWEWATYTRVTTLTNTSIIAMPLLANTTDGFFGPYIDVPESAHNINNYYVDVNSSTTLDLGDLTATSRSGSHCWVIGSDGNVFSIYPSDIYIKVELTQEDFNKKWP